MQGRRQKEQAQEKPRTGRSCYGCKRLVGIYNGVSRCRFWELDSNGMPCLRMVERPSNACADWIPM